MSDGLWDTIVGVPVEMWIGADTPDKFAALLNERDHPRRCTVQHTQDVDVMDWAGNVVTVLHTEPCNGLHLKETA